MNEKYNRLYLKAEYNFAMSSADMAANGNLGGRMKTGTATCCNTVP